MKLLIRKNEMEKLMLLKGLNYITLAKELDCNSSYLSQLVNNRKNPSASFAKRLSAYFDKEINDLFFIVESCKEKEEVR